MKNLKENKGITLIALIITIIVLLILAIVAISAVQGDGIIAHAKSARDDYQTAQGTENSILSDYMTKLNDAQGEDELGLDSENEEEIEGTTLKSYADSSKDGNGFLTENATYTDTESNSAVIPAGFKVSETDREQTISTGLVIKDSSENEFVWVPVTNINEMAKLQSGSETNYEGILYYFSGTTATEMTSYGIGTRLSREPDTLSDSYADGNTSYLSTVGCSTIEEFKTQMQREFNSMVKSVSKYKGFYVARYELSTNGGTLASKAGATVITANTNSNMWYGLYNICKTYNVTNSVQSNMMYGCQYDAMLRWMLTGIEASRVAATSNGNHSDFVSTTGTTSTDKINNVYDLEGNCFEWTQEASSTGARVLHGGCCGRSSSAAISAFDGSPCGTDSNCSARATLYIN